MAGTRPRDLLAAFRRRPRIHGFAQVVEIAIANTERQRRAGGLAAGQAGQHLDLILLDFHAAAAAVTHLAAAEIAVDAGAVERKAGRQAVDDGDQRRAVRLAGGQETQTWHRREITPIAAYCPIERARFMMRGVMKMSSSERSSVSVFSLKNQPRIGISANHGTLCIDQPLDRM